MNEHKKGTRKIRPRNSRLTGLAAREKWHVLSFQGAVLAFRSRELRRKNPFGDSENTLTQRTPKSRQTCLAFGLRKLVEPVQGTGPSTSYSFAPGGGPKAPEDCITSKEKKQTRLNLHFKVSRDSTSRGRGVRLPSGKN